MLTDSNKRDLMTDTSVAKDLLADVLTCAGKTFVVVDGLDEVDEFERRQLLRALIDILGTRRDSGLKIYISSRPEDDIRRILHPTAKAVCVDASNRSGIDTYVNHRFDEWMATSEFHDQRKNEIRALLYHVGLKARGALLPHFCEILFSGTELTEFLVLGWHQGCSCMPASFWITWLT
jgi:hypothetical protein